MKGINEIKKEGKGLRHEKNPPPFNFNGCFTRIGLT
jgi:hypothetical protein